MTNNNTTAEQPFQKLHENSQHLQQKATFTNCQAQTQAECARKANTDIANVDFENVFKLLHEMVELAGGTPRSVRSEPTQRLMAAE